MVSLANRQAHVFAELSERAFTEAVVPKESAEYGLGRFMSRWLILFGLILIVIGSLWPLFAKLGLGRLPGDIVIERGNFRLYLPLATSLIISLVLIGLLWLLNR